MTQMTAKDRESIDRMIQTGIPDNLKLAYNLLLGCHMSKIDAVWHILSHERCTDHCNDYFYSEFPAVKFYVRFGVMSASVLIMEEDGSVSDIFVFKYEDEVQMTDFEPKVKKGLQETFESWKDKI